MASVKITTDMNADSATALFAWGVAVADTILQVGDRKVRAGDLTAAGLHYLAAYGMRESLRDCVSGVEKAIKVAKEDADKGKPKVWDAFVIESGTAGHDVEMVTDGVLLARQTKRFDAIVASVIPVKDSAGRLSGRDAFNKRTALAMIKARCEKKGKAMPAGAELADLLPKFTAAVMAELDAAWAAHNAMLDGAANAADDLI